VTKPDIDRLVAAATKARAHAYAPYSRYRVGAAILTKVGHVYAGCNVENSTFGATICAERSAIAAMVAAATATRWRASSSPPAPSPGAPAASAGRC
jgi:cytidine deaminase